MKKHGYIQGFSFICFVCLLALSFACNANKDKPAPTEDETIEPVYATPVDEPDTPALPRETIEASLETWPEDIPLMEPYTVQTFLPKKESQQLVIVVPFNLTEAYEFYSDNLAGNGWVQSEGGQGIPGVLLITKCSKGNRELDLKIRYDAEEDGSVITFMLSEQAEPGE